MSASFLPLSDGDYYRYIVERIATVKKRLYLNIFIVDSRVGSDSYLLVRRLIRLLAKLQQRDVDVRVILAAATTFDIAMSNATTQLLCNLYGISCRITAETERPSHCKYAILDDEIIIGSHNWESGAFNSFYEDSVAIRDTLVRRALLSDFGSQWRSASPMPLPASDVDDKVARSTALIINRFQKGIEAGRWDWVIGDSVHLLRNDQYFSRARKIIDNAKNSIELMMFYLSVPKSLKSVSKSKQLLTHLLDAVKRGVQVRVILDRDRTTDIYGSRIINKNAYKLLLGAGVDVVFDSVRRVTHSKILVVDGNQVLIGSHNWTDASLRRYDERSADIRSVAVAKLYRDRFDKMYRRTLQHKAAIPTPL